VAAVEKGDAGPLAEALEKKNEDERRKEDASKGRDSGESRRSDRAELAAFAISTQGLSALVAGCRGAGTLPVPLPEFLFEEVSFSRARAMRLRETLGSVVLTLRASGIEVVALKGAALAFFHYPDPALRPMGDLDLLLRDPRDLPQATEALGRSAWRRILDTPRHRVFARPDERVVRPASEDPENPIRVEIHTSFRLPVLGHVFDASAALRDEAQARDLAGTPVAIAAGSAFATHLLFHAAEDFAGNGIRGIQAHDFRLLARSEGRLRVDVDPASHALAPLLYAADAVQRLFPLTFEESLFSSLSSRVSPTLRARAAALPALRYTRPPRGWSRTLLSLLDGPLPAARFLRRVLFPTPGEMKANVAPEASGLALAGAYVRVLARRVASVFRG
jgi:hypothetical protein